MTNMTMMRTVSLLFMMLTNFHGANAFRPQPSVIVTTATSPQVTATADASVAVRGGGRNDKSKIKEDKKEEDTAPALVTHTAVGVVTVLTLSAVAQQVPVLRDLWAKLGWNDAPATGSSSTPRSTSPRSFSKALDSNNNNGNGNHLVPKTIISVLLTSAGLWGLLYGAHQPSVTDFLVDKLQLPREVYGVPPVMYVVFLVWTFASTIVTNVANAVTGLSPSSDSNGWYASLAKPGWNPPSWVFVVMWLVVSKPTQFLALRHVFLNVAKEAPKVASSVAANGSASSFLSNSVATAEPNWKVLALLAVHLALGNAWNDVFFGFQKVGLGLAVMAVFWATLAGSAYLFLDQGNEWAGKLLLPTLGWVTIAAALNLSIYQLNKEGGPKKSR